MTALRLLAALDPNVVVTTAGVVAAAALTVIVPALVALKATASTRATATATAVVATGAANGCAALAEAVQHLYGELAAERALTGREPPTIPQALVDYLASLKVAQRAAA